MGDIDVKPNGVGSISNVVGITISTPLLTALAGIVIVMVSPVAGLKAA